MLGLYDGISKAFKLDIWAVDEYYLDRERVDLCLFVDLTLLVSVFGAVKREPSHIGGSFVSPRVVGGTFTIPCLVTRLQRSSTFKRRDSLHFKLFQSLDH